MILLGLLCFCGSSAKKQDSLLSPFVRSSVSDGFECLILLIMFEASRMPPMRLASGGYIVCFGALLTSLGLAMSRGKSLSAFIPSFLVGIFILVYHRNTVFLVNCVLLVVAIACAFAFILAIPNAFSMGEAFIVGFTVSHVLGLGYLGLSRTFRIVDLTWPTKIGLALCFGSLGATGLWSFLGNRKRSSAERGKVHALLFATIWMAISVLILGKMKAFANVPTILREFTTQTRLTILLEWIGLLMVTVAATSAYVLFTPSGLGHNSALSTRLLRRFYAMQLMRKFYHFMAVPFFVPAIMMDMEWLKFGMLGVMAIFIFLEALRLNCPRTWIARFLTPKMETFRNGLDGGTPVLSHIWLLQGCAFSVMFSGRSNDVLTKLMALSGTFSLGILDSCAALGGKLLKGPRWPHSAKTCSGTIIGIAAMILAQSCIVWFWYQRAPMFPEYLLICASSITSGLWEATSDQNDNITLPLKRPIGCGSQSGSMEELVVSRAENIALSFERFVKERLGVDIDGSLSGELCRFYLRGSCPRGTACPQRHAYSAPLRSKEKSVVCKHWLRGLCKKGDACEFLHEYNLKRMPECWFFTKYGECSNPECLYLHVDPNSKARECAWYARGFCKHGPNCRNKHVRNTACQLYLTGFCPFGPECQFGHPKYEIPTSTAPA